MAPVDNRIAAGLIAVVVLIVAMIGYFVFFRSTEPEVPPLSERGGRAASTAPNPAGGGR